MNLQLNQLLSTLTSFIEKLSVATGSDPYLSKADKESFLAKLDGQELIFGQTLLDYLASLEEGGRITRSDIVAVIGKIQDELLPYFMLAENPVTEQSKVLLSNQNLFFPGLAESWVSLTKEEHTEEPLELLNGRSLEEKLTVLVEGLYFNQYLKGSASIQVGRVPALFQSLTPGTFLHSLQQSGRQEWREIKVILPLLAKGSSAEEFFAEFEEVQETEQQAAAQKVVSIFKTQLSGDLLMRFDFSSREFTRYFLAGISKDQQIVFLYDTYYWT